MSLLTIYYHRDFDGLIATALFLRIYEESQLLGADGVLLKSIDYDQKKTWLKIDLIRPNAVIDFLYHPKAEWWFDHHVSTFLNDKHQARFHNSEKQIWDINSPSCASLIRQSLQSQSSIFLNNDEYIKIIDSFKDWIYWSDIIDNAKYESPQQLIELKHPCLQINATLASDVDDEYLKHVIFYAKTYSAEDVVHSKVVEDKLRIVFQNQEKYMTVFKSNYVLLQHKTVVFDYKKSGIPFQRYLAYYYQPDAEYSVGVYEKAGKISISVGKNPWMEFHSKNIGEICKTFGGGGRTNVGSIYVSSYKKAITIVNKICNLLSL